MVNWQITATTINCDSVGDEVTLLVYKDGTVKCTGYSKYGNPQGKEAAALSKKGLKCLGPLCDYMKSYRQKILKEEEEINKVNNHKEHH